MNVPRGAVVTFALGLGAALPFTAWSAFQSETTPRRISSALPSASTVREVMRVAWEEAQPFVVLVPEPTLAQAAPTAPTARAAKAALVEPEPAPQAIAVVIPTALPEQPPAPTPAPDATPLAPAADVPRWCGTVRCPLGEECCNASCGKCTLPGGTCSNKNCALPDDGSSANCGPNTCNMGQVCCNESCGICTQPGDMCSVRICDGPTMPFSMRCGRNTCNVGEVCCNASCGICAAPDTMCSQQPCW